MRFSGVSLASFGVCHFFKSRQAADLPECFSSAVTVSRTRPAPTYSPQPLGVPLSADSSAEGFVTRLSAHITGEATMRIRVQTMPR